MADDIADGMVKTHRSQKRLHDVIAARRSELLLTQGALAQKLGYKNSSFITMIERATMMNEETGQLDPRSKVPFDRALDFAKALDLDPDWFMERLMREYYPSIAEHFYGKAAKAKKVA